MTGGEPYDGTGDPEFVNVVRPLSTCRATRSSPTRRTPRRTSSSSACETRRAAKCRTSTLDCAGVLGGWTPVGSAGRYEMTRVDLSTGDFQGVGGCDNGVHTIASSLSGARFGVTMWGWGNDITWPTDTGPIDEANPEFTRWVSYGYPAGANFKPLSGAVLPAH